MNETERAEVVVTARLLRAAGRVDWLGTGVTLLAGVGLLLSKGNGAAMVVALLLGVAAKVYFVRIVFDARLFEDVAEGRVSTPDLDRALSSVGGAEGTPGERPWSDRCRGARRLIVVGAVITIVQCLVLLVGALAG